MRVLVTGGAGFIGSHVLRALLGRGDEVVVLDNFEPTYDPAIKAQNIAGLPLRLIQGDLRDPQALEAALRGADAVVHLAARAGVRESLAEPALYRSINVEGTGALLQALRPRPLPLIFASSSSVYGARPGDRPFSEDEPLAPPQSPYAATKREGEQLLEAASADWGLPAVALRFFTVYGPRQRPSMAISLFLRRCRAGLPLTLYGDGSATRDFTYAEDAAAGVLAALDRPGPYRVCNIGSGAPVRLDELVAAVGRAVLRSPQVELAPPQPGDVPHTHADIRKAGELLGWRPRVRLEEGLRRTAAQLEGSAPP